MERTLRVKLSNRAESGFSFNVMYESAIPCLKPLYYREVVVKHFTETKTTVMVLLQVVVSYVTLRCNSLR